MRHDQILRESGMSSRPEYYSGRGATTSDLNSDILEKIYTLVKRHHGDDAARNFVQMVHDLPSLPATTFILAFEGLAYNGWKWVKPAEGEEPSNIHPTDLATGFATIAEVMFKGNRPDMTHAIRSGFLWSHKKEYTPDPNEKKGGFVVWGY